MLAQNDGRLRARFPATGEGWEPHRAAPPPGLTQDVREAREDSRLLLMVVRARLAEGTMPFEHAEALGRVAEDQRIKVRQRRVAAALLGRIRLTAIARPPATSASRIVDGTRAG